MQKPTDAGDHLSIPEQMGNCHDPALCDHEVDNEGRAVILEFDAMYNGNPLTLCVINVYCPRWNPDDAIRLEYKMRFHRLLEARIRRELANGKRVMVVGDVNVAHRREDHCEHDLIDNFDLLPHRQWINRLLSDDGPCRDVFRHFHPNQKKAYTCWNQSINARAVNYGTRIDYILADKESVETGMFSDCRLLPNVTGSDHCPVMVDFAPQFAIVSSRILPAICCRLMFRGIQTSIRSFFIPPIGGTIEKSPRPNRNGQLPTESTASKRSKPVEASSSTAPLPDRPLTTTTESTNDDALSRLKRPRRPPNCTGHNEPSRLMFVRKDGPNKNRPFYACARPMGGAYGDREGKCSFFQWEHQ